MTARDWLQKAKNEKFAIGAFNVGNLETFKAIVQAAANKKSPVIIECSEGEVKWMGLKNMVSLAQNYSQEYGVPIILNLDHAEDAEYCIEAIGAGFDLIHFDGSRGEFEENLANTKRVVEVAHDAGKLVEAEIDRMATKSSQVYKEDIPLEEIRKTFSDPERCAKFVADTGVDTLATLFGNVHGIVPHQPHLDFEVFGRITQALPNTFLSLHGSSGIDEGEVKHSIEMGIVKVNLNTEMRVAFKDTLKKVLDEHPEEYALYKVYPEVLKAVQDLVEHKIELFGSSNKV